LEYYTIQSQHSSWDKTVKKENLIPDFSGGDAVVVFRLITALDCLVVHLH
jgi:hypothetical protein